MAGEPTHPSALTSLPSGWMGLILTSWLGEKDWGNGGGSRELRACGGCGGSSPAGGEWVLTNAVLSEARGPQQCGHHAQIWLSETKDSRSQHSPSSAHFWVMEKVLPRLPGLGDFLLLRKSWAGQGRLCSCTLIHSINKHPGHTPPHTGQWR